MLLPTLPMDFSDTLPIWAAADPILQIVGTILFIVFAILGQIFSARKESQKNQPEDQNRQLEREDDLTITNLPEVRSKVSKERLRRKVERETLTQSYRPAPVPQREERLANALQPQGVGARFDASPGTFDGAQIVASSVVPTINPILDSMTGAFDDHAQTNVRLKDNLGLRQLLTTPQGIRQAVVLSEIMKRPDF